MNQPIYIVGNKIKQQLGMPNLVTFDEFIGILNSNNINAAANNNVMEFRIGQGLSKQSIDTIFLITNNIANNRYTFANTYKHQPQICNKVTHKHSIKNTMISVPEQINDKLYQSHLFLDEECAEMSDHTTGCHIQGMVLIEAARQMVNAVTEKYLINQEHHNSYFVLNELNTTFKHYIFPIDVEILYKTIGIRYGLKGSFSATAEVSFIQNNITAFIATIKHQAMDAVIMSNHESQLARRYLNAN